MIRSWWKERQRKRQARRAFDSMIDEVNTALDGGRVDEADRAVAGFAGDLDQYKLYLDELDRMTWNTLAMALLCRHKLSSIEGAVDRLAG